MYSWGSRDRVYLDGTGSSDPDGSVAGSQWTQVPGKNVSIDKDNEPVAHFRAPRVRRGRTEVLVFELTVNDDAGAVATDQVTVTVTR